MKFQKSSFRAQILRPQNLNFNIAITLTPSPSPSPIFLPKILKKNLVFLIILKYIFNFFQKLILIKLFKFILLLFNNEYGGVNGMNNKILKKNI